MGFMPDRQSTSVRPSQVPSKASYLSPDFMGNRFVTVTVSSQAGGLSIVVNLHPHAEEVIATPELDGGLPVALKNESLPVDEMARELRQTLELIQKGLLSRQPHFSSFPPELLQLRNVTLTGDEDPTLIPNFAEAIQSVVWLRALGAYFKIVLITRGNCLHYPEILQGIDFLTKTDEIWISLDGGARTGVGSPDYPDLPPERIMSNILLIGRKRPVVIQSSFSLLKNQDQPLSEIHKYVMRLNELKDGGAQISHVQICSDGTRQLPAKGRHLSLRVLSQIAQTIRQTTGLRVEVF